MIVEYSKNPTAFDWKSVDVKARELSERAIRSGELVNDDALSAEQKAHLKERLKEYEDIKWARLRPELEQVFKRHGEAPPPTFRRVIRPVAERGKPYLEYGEVAVRPGAG